MNTSPTPHPVRRQLLLIIFIVSGFSGLIYESIWSHYLKLFLGHAAYAQTLVLAIFMGGMALGSWLVARASSRIRQLLLGYVIVEGLIGLLGLVFHRGFVALTDFSFETVIPQLGSGAGVHLYKWTLATLLILPQSVLLGMTFPLISGGIIRRWPQQPGATLSMLYFTNSLGAALGVLVSGFVLIRLVGLPGTIMTAGLLNVALALAVWAIAREQTEPPPGVAPPSIAEAAANFSRRRWLLTAAFVTGAACFMYEIGWIRMLSLVLGSSTHSFELMLSAFILGLALGGLWMRRRIDQILHPLRLLGAIMLAMAVLALMTVPAYNRTFDMIAWALRAFARTGNGYIAFNVTGQLIAALIMMPTTFLAGMTLPLLTTTLLRDGGERAIGVVYAANTLGAIAGVILAAHVAMPLIGVKGVVATGVVLHMALGVSGLALSRALRPSLVAAAAVACAAALAVILTGVQLDPRRMTSGVYRTGVSSQPAEATVRYLRDGKTATISLVEHQGRVMIATNGKVDAAIRMNAGPASPDEITMILAAALPLSMHPHPRRVANIGFGSGLTSHTVLGSSRLERLDSIEIEPFMVDAARTGFLPRIRRVFEDPRSHIVYEDAKTFFAAARAPYDVIISEPSNPWVSGVATLFSEEFYRRIKHYLRPDGYLVQWLQIYETDMSVVASVVKALSAEFGDYAIYNADDSNVLIIAARSRLQPLTTALFENAVLNAELARVGIQSTQDIVQRRIGDRRTLQSLLQSYPVPANSDYFPFVDLNAARLRYMQSSAIELPSLLTLPLPVAEMLGPRDMKAEYVPSVNSLLFRDAMVRQSIEIRTAVETMRVDHVGPIAAGAVLLVGTDAKQCGSPVARVAWRRAVREIADLTTPFQPARSLRGVWERVKASPCYASADERDKQWTDLLAAIAARDPVEIGRLGSRLLDHSVQPLTAEERSYILVAVATAYLANDARSGARPLLERELATFEPTELYRLALRQLWALSAEAGDRAR